jgi:hypothetical protein
MHRPALLILLLILVASTGRAQDSPDVYLGERCPLPRSTDSPRTAWAVPGGEITVAALGQPGPPAMGAPAARRPIATWPT